MANKIPVGIGSGVINIDVSQFANGLASSDYANDGGLGTSSTNLNPFITPGLIYSTATATDKSTNVADNIIATSEDSQATGFNNRILLGSTGRIYSVANSGTVTAQVTAGSDTYAYGQSDMVPFKGLNYYSSSTHLATVNTSGSSWSRNESAHNFADSSALHPLLVFEQVLWGGDGNNLVSYDGTTFNTAASWVLDTSEKIVALGIDPYTGLMMVSVQTSYNPTDTLQNRGVVYLYDGYSSKPRRKIYTDDIITAFYNVGGTIYVGMGQVLGAWNGNGVTFLRRLKNVTLVQNDLPYKHHFANIRNILLVLDGTKVLAYGEVLPGKKAFFPIGGANTATSPTTICRVGNNTFAVSSATNTFALTDITSTSSGTGNLYIPNINFPRPVFIRKMRIITTNITTTAGLGNITVSNEHTTYQPAVNQFVVSSSGSPQNVFDFYLGDFKAHTFQPIIGFDTQGFAIVRITIYYDVAE